MTESKDPICFPFIKAMHMLPTVASMMCRFK